MIKILLFFLIFFKLHDVGFSNVLVEEFQASGPMDFHSLAMNNFLELRKKDPSVNLNHDGEFLKRANEHAIRRMRRRPDIELSLQVIYLSFSPFL